MPAAESSSDRLRAVLESLVLAAGVCRIVRDANGSAVDLEFRDALVPPPDWYGYLPAEMVGRRYSEVFPTGLHDRLPHYLAALTVNEAATAIIEWQQADGRAVTLEAGVLPFGADEALMTMRDITSTQRRLSDADAERAIAERDRRMLAAAFDASSDGLVVLRVSWSTVDVTGLSVDFVNETAAAGTDRSAKDWIGADGRDWITARGLRGLNPHILTAAQSHSPVHAQITARPMRGSPAEFDVSVVPHGADLVFVFTREAAGAIGATVAGATEDGGRDRLTGLLTRGGFHRELARWLQHRAPEDPPGAVYAFDLDDFGRINDLVGTQRADLVLVAIAAQLRALEPWLLFPARIGADEFAFVIPDAGPDADADAVRTHSPRILRQATIDARTPPLTASGGARVAERGMSAEEILRDCDIAMRSSVRDGGSRLTTYDPGVRRRLMSEYVRGEDIRRGLADAQFQLAFQPIVRVETTEHVGDEALARWHHPQHGLVTPDRFIPIAEATGIIVDFGAWVVDEAFAYLATSGHRRQVGINVSGAQLLNSDVPGVVAAAAERYRVPAERVAVEITESSILPDSTRIRDQLTALRQLGVQVAVDDFGSGYSSLAYLDWIPVDLVKLDRLFLLGDLDRRRRSLIAATAQLIRSIGARSLAEGIETRAQLDAVREAGIDYGQGYLFGRPRFPTAPTAAPIPAGAVGGLPTGWRY